MRAGRIFGAVILPGALVFGTLAMAGAASATETGGARPVVVQPAGVWEDTGRHFIALSTCRQQGLTQVQLENAAAYACDFDDFTADYDLRLFID